jgi:hypothetical protein
MIAPLQEIFSVLPATQPRVGFRTSAQADRPQGGPQRLAAEKQHFGIRSEKLAEFILQPFRSRKKPADAQKQSRKKSPDGAPPHPAEPTL